MKGVRYQRCFFFFCEPLELPRGRGARRAGLRVSRHVKLERRSTFFSPAGWFSRGGDGLIVAHLRVFARGRSGRARRDPHAARGGSRAARPRGAREGRRRGARRGRGDAARVHRDGRSTIRSSPPSRAAYANFGESANRRGGRRSGGGGSAGRDRRGARGRPGPGRCARRRGRADAGASDAGARRALGSAAHAPVPAKTQTPGFVSEKKGTLCTYHMEARSSAAEIFFTDCFSSLSSSHPSVFGVVRSRWRNRDLLSLAPDRISLVLSPRTYCFSALWSPSSPPPSPAPPPSPP